MTASLILEHSKPLPAPRRPASMTGTVRVPSRDPGSPVCAARALFETPLGKVSSVRGLGPASGVFLTLPCGWPCHRSVASVRSGFSVRRRASTRSPPAAPVLRGAGSVQGLVWSLGAPAWRGIRVCWCCSRRSCGPFTAAASQVRAPASDFTTSPPTLVVFRFWAFVFFTAVLWV